MQSSSHIDTAPCQGQLGDEPASGSSSPGCKLSLIKKTKKVHKRLFPQILQVDKEAFDDIGQRSILEAFWRNRMNKILVAMAPEGGKVLGYAIFCPEPDDTFYLMRIAVRTSC